MREFTHVFATEKQRTPLPLSQVNKRDGYAIRRNSPLAGREEDHLVPAVIPHTLTISGFSADVPIHSHGSLYQVVGLEFQNWVSERFERHSTLPERTCLHPEDIRAVVVDKRARIAPVHTVEIV